MLKNGGPRAAELALYMLSPEGQATLARFGFISVSLPLRAAAKSPGARPVECGERKTGYIRFRVR